MTTATISYTSLRQNLSSVLNKIEKNKEAFFVTRKKHPDIVMVARDDYESLVETLHLLSNAANAKRLNQALEQDAKGEYVKVEF
ncbi:MAG: type II toxin-antitoxin system Phd/YefM family antitoxin [Pseudomonadota bacterium]